MKQTTKYIIGVMSGTSLDGIDIVYVKINYTNNYTFEIINATTIPYSKEWKSDLKEGFHFSVRGGQTGHLPLPGPMGYLVLSRARAFFSRMKKEKAFLDRVGRMDLEEEKVTILMKR